MARFYAEIKGNRGAASRMGSAASGMWSHTRGWEAGAEVECHAQGGLDSVAVTLTSGSNGGPKLHVADVRIMSDGTRRVRLYDDNRETVAEFAY